MNFSFFTFSVISSFFKSSSGCFTFSMIFSFLAIFLVLQWTFLNFPPFPVFLAIFHVLKCVFLIFQDFQFSRHIQGPTVCDICVLCIVCDSAPAVGGTCRIFDDNAF